MSLLSSPVSSLINGVSQQPASLRFPSQVQAQENAYSSITSGLNKRHPSQHVAGPLSGVDNITGAFTHIINRDVNNRYAVVAYRDGSDNANLKVFDLTTGASVVVKNTAGDPVGPSDLVYLNTTGMADDLKAVTVVDHTWLLNTTKSPTMLSGAVSSTRKNEALVVLWKYRHGHTYKIRVEDKVFSWRTRESGLGDVDEGEKRDERAATQSQTWVAEQLFVELAGLSDVTTVGLSGDLHAAANVGGDVDDAPYATGGDLDNNGGKGLNGGGGETGAGGYVEWVIKQTGPVIHIYRSDEADFDISVVDDSGEDAFTVVKDEVQVLAHLPTKAPSGMRVKVVGDEEAGVDDDYFVEFLANGTPGGAAIQAERQHTIYATDTEALSDGLWRESIEPGIPDEFDPATMPHKLIDQGSYFDFVPATWTNKLVGDEFSNPSPSFIDTEITATIKDIFFYKNRLGFLADDNVIMSETGAYDNFFRTTVIQLVDSDPIDIGIAHSSVAKPNHAVPFQDSLILFTETSQFILSGDEVLSPKTSTIEYSTEFENSIRVKPIPTGRTIFFAQKKSAFGGVREYYQIIRDELNDALDITAHIPAYIKGDITHMAGSTHDNILVVHSDGAGDEGSIYVYKYLVGKDEKLQSSWSRYTLDGAAILGLEWIDTDLYILAQRSDQLFIEKMTIEPGLTDTDSSGESIGFICHLDRRVNESELVSQAYDSDEDQTTFTLPYQRQESDDMVIVVREDGEFEGREYGTGSQLTPVDNFTESVDLKVSGDFSEAEVFIGVKYEMSVTLSTPYIKPQPGAPIYATGRFQLMYGHLIYHESDYFRVEVTPTHRTMRKTEFNSGLLGATINLGNRTPHSGQLKFPIYARNDQAEIKIINDTPMSTSIMGLEYEAQFNPRASRIG